MRKQILAVVAGIALVGGFLTPTLYNNNAFAQVTAESRVLQAILGLTDQIKQQTSEIKGKYDDIIFDLELKKKFWQYNVPIVCLVDFGGAGTFAVACDQVSENSVSSQNGGVSISQNGDTDRLLFGIGIYNRACDLGDACAFNMESAQLVQDPTDDNVAVGAIFADFVLTDTTSKELFLDTNLMVDSGIGRVGASSHIVPLVEFLPGQEVEIAFLEFNGEKPQDMQLGLLVIIITIEDGSIEFNFVNCHDLDFSQVTCPPELEALES